MKFSIRLLESDKEISLKIGNALLPEVRKYMAKVTNKIRSELPNILEDIITNSQTYNDLSRGKLRLELGIPDPVSKILGILAVWSQNINLVYSPPFVTSSGTIQTSLTVGIVKSDYSDILGTSYAYVYDNVRGYQLPWLQWLLLEGNKTIIDNYRVSFINSPKSRTGGALMRPSTSSNWSVPNIHAGSIGDNWITRAIDDNKNTIDKFLQETLKP